MIAQNSVSQGGRVVPIRPKINDYDIINPYTHKEPGSRTGSRGLRMSSVGARILRKNPAPSDLAAGVKKVAKEGEANMD